MAKTIFEQMGGTYTQVGDYLLPDLKLPEEETQANIGVWGMRHKRFLKENHRVLYANLMTSGKLVAYLDYIEQQATDMFLRLVKELAEKENVTEELKAADQMLWVLFCLKRHLPTVQISAEWKWNRYQDIWACI